MHPSVGDKGSQVAIRMRMRCEARHAFVKAQANQMLHRLFEIELGPGLNHKSVTVAFSTVNFVEKGFLVWSRLGMAPVSRGIQGQSNVWVVFGGKCYLIVQEHCRPAVGEEAIYGRPEIQEASVFSGVCNPPIGVMRI